MTQTKVTVKEGQTLVIGGLIREKVRAGVTKVPLLGDVPFLGSFFRSKKDEKQKVELLVLVSPTIITPQVLTQMAKQERYGAGRRFAEERKSDAQKILDLEAQEKLARERLQELAMQRVYQTQEQRENLALQMSFLEEKQRALQREREGLEVKISNQEKNLKSLKGEKEAIVEKRRRLEKAIK
jgi:Flp pilus assembly secretin CpaC